MDGVWGPQSQRAWSAYVSGRRYDSQARSIRSRRQEARRRAERVRRERIQAIRAKASAAAAAARAQVQARIQAQARLTANISRVERVKRGEIRQAPNRAANMDAVEGIRVRRANEVRRATVIRERIEFEKTRSGMVAMRLGNLLAMEEATRRKGMKGPRRIAAKMSLANTVDLLFDPYRPGFDPENRSHVRIVQQFLRGQGKKVTPDGIYGQETHNALVNSFREAREAEERRQRRVLVSTFYDSGLLKPGTARPDWLPIAGVTPKPGDLLALLQRGGFSAAVVWKALTQQLDDPYVQFLAFREQQFKQIARTLDFDGLASSRILPYTRRQARLAVWLHPSMHTPEAFAKLRALDAATSFEDFEHRIRQYAKWEEAEYLRRQKEIAARDLPWWGKALHWYDEVGDKLRVRLMADVMFALKDPGDYFTDYDRDIDKWEAKAIAEIADSPTAVRFAYEVIADPLVFLPIGKIAQVGGKGALASLNVTSTAALRASLAPGLAGRNFGNALARAGSALDEAHAERLWLPKVRENVVHSIATGGAGMAPLAVYRGYRTATRLKQEALSAARESVEWSMNHGFQPVKQKLGQMGVGNGFRDWIPEKETMDLLTATDEQIRRALPTVYPAMIRALHSERISLWTNASRPKDGWSSVGADLRGYWYAKLRVMETHRLAKYSADDVRDRIYSETPGAYRGEDGRWVLPLDTPEGAAAHGRAMKEASAEYERVKKGVGVYRRGSGDEELLSALDRRVEQLSEKLDNVILPALQKHLEELAEYAGFRLFDEAGLWVGRQGAAQGALRRMARAGFDPENLVKVENPLHLVPMPFLKAKEHIESEIRRRQTRILAYYGREVERGNPMGLTEDWLQRRLAEEAEEVWSAWRPVNVDGKQMYQDTREVLEESPLYAGHLEQTFEVSYRDAVEDVEGWQEKLLAIASAPADAGGKTLNLELGRSLWALGSRHGEAPFGLTAADETARVGRGRFPIMESEKTYRAALQGFRDSVTARQVVLAKAYTEAYPKALWEERALWQALSHAQTRPLKVVYTVLDAHLKLWLFATLPLSVGWRVRNVIDNTAKSLIHGVRDPRAYGVGGAVPGSRIKTVFDHDLRAVRHVARHFDSIFNTRVEDALMTLSDTVWQHSSSVLSRIFKTHGIEVPEHILDTQRFVSAAYDGPKSLRILNADIEDLDPVQLRGLFGDAGVGVSDNIIRFAEKHRRLSPDELLQEEEMRSLFAKFKDMAWELMGARPENRARRIVYRDTYYKARERHLAAGADTLVAEREAFKEAVKSVERVLFDYSKMTVVEDNLRILFPFIQYWRKNSAFWIRNVAEKPWLPVTIARFEEYRQDAHSDWPEWMRRYFHAKEASFITNRVPGLDWLVKWSGLDDTMYDPLNFLSFSPLYRLFKNENYALPEDKKGWAFIAPMVDAIADVGLGLNPLVRKPLEHAGVVNERAWRSVFPQTGMAQAITRKFIGDFWADKIIDLDSVFGDPLGAVINASKEFFDKETTWDSDRYRRVFEEWVRVEQVNQLARGEQTSREAAVKKIQSYFLLNTVVGFFTSAYVRRMTPEDFYLYKLTEDVFVKGIKGYNTLSAREKELLKVWGMRKTDRVAFETYLDYLPLIRTYYQLPSYAEKERMKQEHPEIIPHVEPAWRGDPFPLGYVQQASLLADSQLAFQMFDLAKTLKLDPETRSLAERTLVTPALRQFWSKNDTPAERRDKQMRGIYHRYLRHMSDTFFAIPEGDYDAKESFLREHPELRDYWNENNTDADDYKMILQETLADLRDRYFEFVDAGDWDSANAFLNRFPFTFDGFEGDQYVVDRTTGRPKFAGSKGVWGSGSSGWRSGWTRSQHARDYMKAKRWLDHYFSLPYSQRLAWLNGGSEGASIVKWYFDKYASQRSGGRGGMTQHARDYLAAKQHLDFYFSLGKAERRAWLNGGSEGAQVVLAYFKKYAKNNRLGRSFGGFAAGDALLASRNAELRTRLIFWQKYWSLTPDQRPLFVMRQAERHGIFVYGQLGERERNDREAEWLRRANAMGATEKAAHYLYVKPLLDLFFKLKDSDEKALFLRANPEVQEYLDKYAHKSVTGNARLDKLIERYFKLPEDSQARSTFLRKHPEVQQYFDKKAKPAERAMRRLLTVYFEIEHPKDRERFLQRHPEIEAYFDRRQRERENEKEQLEAFDAADPRLRRFFDAAEEAVDERGERMQKLLASRKADRIGTGGALTVRRP